MDKTTKHQPATPPVVQIAQALTDDVAKRGEVAELIYGTEKTRFAQLLVQCHSERAKLVAALRGIVDCARARNVKIDKAAECDAIASTVLRELGEAS